VSVTSTAEQAPVSVPDTASKSPNIGIKAAARAYLITPGERLRIAKAGPSKLDEPRVEAVTAWRRGEVMLDETPLSDAVAEMNRYNKSALIIDEARIANLKVSGIYHTGDSGGFAATVANLYGLRVTEADNGIHLSSAPPSSR
jgi:transmembrane sensor